MFEGRTPLDDLAVLQLQRSVWSGVLSVHRQVVVEKIILSQFLISAEYICSRLSRFAHESFKIIFGDIENTDRVSVAWKAGRQQVGNILLLHSIQRSLEPIWLCEGLASPGIKAFELDDL